MREGEKSPWLIVAKCNSDELSLLRGKGDGNVQVRGLSVLINAMATSPESSRRREEEVGRGEGLQSSKWTRHQLCPRKMGELSHTARF